MQWNVFFVFPYHISIVTVEAADGDQALKDGEELARQEGIPVDRAQEINVEQA